MQEKVLAELIKDLADNYRNDKDVLSTILNDTISNALFVSNRSYSNNNIMILLPEIKEAVKSIYLQRGSEGSSSVSELGTSNSFKNPLEEMKKSIVSNGKRLIY